MLQKLVTWLTGGVTEQVGEFFIQRQKLKQQIEITKLEGTIRVEAARTEALIAQQQHVATWEMAQIANSGYKDEVVLGVLLVPYIGAFIPVVQDYILVGFGYLDKMPYWAVGLTVTIFLAVYGIRHKNASKIQAPGLRNADVAPGEKNAVN